MKTNLFSTLVLAIAACASVSVAVAQESKPAAAPPADGQRHSMRSRADGHVELLHSLGLTEDQMVQIKKIHMEQKAQMDQAQKRLREASRALNETIYADQVNESDVQTRLSELQLSRAEVEKIRYSTELSVRRILTQEQLIRFREMRQKFEQRRKEMEMRRDDRRFERQRPGGDPKRSPGTPSSGQPSNFHDHMDPVI